ncbi:hypothetical protein LINPERPRIM_LOCUS29132 [Linum perenne]
MFVVGGYRAGSVHIWGLDIRCRD